MSAEPVPHAPAGTPDDPTAAQLIDAAMRVFGPQPASMEFHIKDAADPTDGVPVVLRELTEPENADLLAAVGASPVDLIRQGLWERETIIRALVSFDNIAFLPIDGSSREAMAKSIEWRRKIVMHPEHPWPHQAIVALKDAYEVFMGELQATKRLIMYHPKAFGASDGRPFAPADAGPANPSVA